MNAISSDGLRALANILKEFPLLEGLDISRSCINKDDISVLCKGLVTGGPGSICPRPPVSSL